MSVRLRRLFPGVDPGKIIGQYSGKLSNGGERIRLIGADGMTIADLSYDNGDPWPKWADGLGGSLVLADPENTPWSEAGKALSIHRQHRDRRQPGRSRFRSSRRCDQ